MREDASRHPERTMTDSTKNGTNDNETPLVPDQIVTEKIEWQEPTETPDAEQINAKNLAVALQHADRGIRIIPMQPVRKPNGDWRKIPLVGNWDFEASADCETIQDWWRRFPDAIPGIPLRRPGLIVVDTDRHTDSHDGVEAFNRLASEQEPMPVHPITRTAGNGEHHYFRQPADGKALGNSKGALPDGIEVRGAGGVIVAPGSVRPDGAVWECAGEVPSLVEAFAQGTIPEIPAWITNQIRQRKLPTIEAAAFESHDLNREHVYAAKALKEGAEEVAVAATGTRNETLNKIAYHLGRMVANGWLDEGSVATELYQACGANGLIDDDGERSAQETIASGLRAGKLKPHPPLPDRVSVKEVVSPSLIWDGNDLPQQRPWLVKDLIPQGSVGLLVGESGTAKSFTSLHLSHCVAGGTEFFSKRTVPGGTLFVAAEAASTIPGRMKAARYGPNAEFMNEDGTLPPDIGSPGPVAILSKCPNLLTEGGVRELLAAAAQANERMEREFGVPLRLIIVDTLIAGFQIDSWNDPAQTGKVMSALENVANYTGTTVLGIHHHGKDISRGPAGSYALTAASDFILTAFRDVDDDGNVSRRWLSVTKQRDGETGWSCEFELEQCRIGTDRDGEGIFVGYVKPLTETAGIGRPRKKAKAKSSEAFKQAFDQASDEFGQNRLTAQGTVVSVSIERVREIFLQNYKSKGSAEKKAEAARKAFPRALEEARRSGMFESEKSGGTEYVWLARAE
jgi:Bifunctional DNA primase/polymerase, N-terminal/AAA domain